MAAGAPLTPDEWSARLATLPLIDQPGAGFHYGHSTDLLGFLLARLDGAPLSTVLERRVFGPLGMHDTGFTVPWTKRDRRAALCGFDSEGRLTTLSQAPGGHALAERPGDITFESGGQGLWSTLDDYLAFARMRGGAGTIGWPGAYGSWWQADPNDRSVLIFLSHNMVELQQWRVEPGSAAGTRSAGSTGLRHRDLRLRVPALTPRVDSGKNKKGRGCTGPSLTLSLSIITRE